MTAATAAMHAAPLSSPLGVAFAPTAPHSPASPVRRHRHRRSLAISGDFDAEEFPPIVAQLGAPADSARSNGFLAPPPQSAPSARLNSLTEAAAPQFTTPSNSRATRPVLHHKRSQSTTHSKPKSLRGKQHHRMSSLFTLFRRKGDENAETAAAPQNTNSTTNPNSNSNPKTETPTSGWSTPPQFRAPLTPLVNAPQPLIDLDLALSATPSSGRGSNENTLSGDSVGFGHFGSFRTHKRAESAPVIIAEEDETETDTDTRLGTHKTAAGSTASLASGHSTLSGVSASTAVTKTRRPARYAAHYKRVEYLDEPNQMPPPRSTRFTFKSVVYEPPTGAGYGVPPASSPLADDLSGTTVGDDASFERVLGEPGPEVRSEVKKPKSRMLRWFLDGKKVV